MRKTFWIVCILLTLAVAAGLLVWLGRTEDSGERLRPEEPASEPPPTKAASEPPAPAVPEWEPMQFSREGLAEPIVRHVGRVGGPEHTQVAVREDPKGPRWVCVVVDMPDRYYELDEGWRPEDFPFLAEAGFQPPPQATSMTMSIYRSVTKMEMKYLRARGDRVMVLLCPKAEWSQLNFSWPPRKPGP